MAIAKHLMENFKKITYDEENQLKDLKIYINNHPISGYVGKKKYNISNKDLYVYNIKVDIKSFSKGDVISFIFGKDIKFEFYDSDENTFMYISDHGNYLYSFIGYDTDYNWENSEFINASYSYAFTGDIDNNCFEYHIINNPQEYLSVDVEHIINVWIVKINKNDYPSLDKEKIFDDISIKLL